MDLEIKIKNYYAVSGASGFGVYDNYNKAKHASEYVRGAAIEKCSNFFDAFKTAKDNYNSLYEMDGEFDDYFFGDSLDIKLNWLLFKGDIRKMNRAKSSCTY